MYIFNVYRLHEQTNVPYEEMLFIDNDTADIPALNDLNVTCYLIPNQDGLSLKDMEEAFLDYYRKRPTPVPVTPSRRKRASRATISRTTTNSYTIFFPVASNEYLNDSLSLSSAPAND